MPPSEEPRLIAGRYRLRSVLGSGSMGTVWSAYDEYLHRPVAIKEVRLPPGIAAAQLDELRERTLREARAIAVLSHPNVIILHDVAKENDEPFIVMELLPSRSIAELLREHGPLSVKQGAAVADAVAAALEAAHQAGITHRDVKPGNVLISSDGRIKLTDFGISRSVSEATMTHTGIMLGSPAYIAPEVASGQAVSPAADLWGLGATLFAAIEGKPPYDVRGNPLDTVNQVVHGKVPEPSPGPLASLITELMNKDPLARTSLAEVRQQLHPLLTVSAHKLFPPTLFAATEDKKVEAISSTKRQAAIEIPNTPDLPKKSTVEPDLSTVDSPRKRGKLVNVVLVLISIVLFLAAVLGGFAMTRALGGQPLVPPTSQPLISGAPIPAQFETRTGDATNLKGTKGGLFTVQVPQGWSKFVTQQPAAALPASTLVEFASTDGAHVLTIQRVANFYPTHRIEEYLKSVEAPWPKGDFVRISLTTLKNRQEGVGLTYRTIEQATSTRKNPSASSTIGRSTFVEAFRADNNLWVVSVTVPTEQESTGQNTLFDRIAPTFATTD